MSRKLLKNFSIITIFGITNKIASYIKENLLAYWMQTSAATDALSLALRLPKLISKCTAGNSLSNVLIPIFSHLNAEKKENYIKYLIRQLIIIFTTIFTILAFIQIFFLKFIMQIIAPGKKTSPETLYWVHHYSYLLAPASILFFLSGLSNAILNYKEKYIYTSVANIIFNLIMIIFCSIAAYFKLDLHYASFIYLIAILIFTMFTLIPSMQIKFRNKSSTSEKEYSKQTLIEFFQNFFPMIITNSKNQINYFILSRAISFLPIGSLTIFNRCEKILQIPIFLILPLTTTLLTTLAKKTNKKIKLFNLSALIISCIAIPITFLMFFFPTTIVNLQFYFAKLNLQEIKQMSQIIQILAFAVPAILIDKIISTFFFSQKEVKFPTIAALFNAILTIILSKLLISYELKGIATTVVISSWSNTLMLIYNLRQHQKSI